MPYCGADTGSLTDKNIGIVNNGKALKFNYRLNLTDWKVLTRTLTASDSITVGSGDTTTVVA